VSPDPGRAGERVFDEAKCGFSGGSHGLHSRWLRAAPLLCCRV